MDHHTEKPSPAQHAAPNPVDQQPAPAGTPEEQKRDHVLDRPAGEDYSPVPADIVAQNRARFDEVNQRLHENMEQAAAALEAQQVLFEEQAEQAAQDPAHQAMLPHQAMHALSDPLAEHAGQQREVREVEDPGSGVDAADQPPVDTPVAPLEPDRSMHPRVQ